MSKLSLIVAAALMAAPLGAALAQSTTTTTTTESWSPDQGQELTKTWTSNKYTSTTVQNFQPEVGVEVPTTVTAYPLPQNITIPDRERYSYTVIDNRPVVFDTTTRKVVHTW
jgi:ABC-type glycerol-3-phosphate transport system substrate-binding protein